MISRILPKIIFCGLRSSGCRPDVRDYSLATAQTSGGPDAQVPQLIMSFSKRALSLSS